jgi:hypothetical protein
LHPTTLAAGARGPHAGGGPRRERSRQVTDGACARGRLKVAARTWVEWPAGGLEEGRRENLGLAGSRACGDEDEDEGMYDIRDPLNPKPYDTWDPLTV